MWVHRGRNGSRGFPVPSIAGRVLLLVAVSCSGPGGTGSALTGPPPGPPFDPAPTEATVRYVNRSPFDIVGVYFRACGQTNWGANRLAGEPVIAPGEQRDFSLDPGCYDRRVVTRTFDGGTGELVRTGAQLGAGAILGVTIFQAVWVPGVQGGVGCVDTATGESVLSAWTLVAYGGRPISMYTWTIAPGSVAPQGVNVEPQTGIVHRTGRLVPGRHTLRIRVTDRVPDGAVAEADVSVTVEEAGPPIGCGSGIFQQSVLPVIALPTTAVGADFGASLFVTLGGGANGAERPLRWDVAEGALPPGLVLNRSSGDIHGNVTGGADRTFDFTIRVTDARGRVAACPNAGVCPTYRIFVWK